MNILIVDDSKLLRAILKNMLSNMGFTKINEAVNGLEAIRKVHVTNPDVIFMNMVMPEMDGYNASKEILKTNPDVKIVIMSSNDFSDTPFSKSNLKIHDYAQIPLNNNKLRKILGG